MNARPDTHPDSSVGPFLRTTVLTSSKAVDVVLPTDQPVAGLLPVLVDLLDVPAGGWGHHLARPDGTVLPPDQPLRRSGLVDGVHLRLLDADQSPPDPVVYDLVDAVEEERPASVWSHATRGLGLHLVAASILVAAALLAVLNGGIDLSSALVVVAGVGLAACVLTRLAEQVATAWVWFGVAWVTLAVAIATTDLWPWWVSAAAAPPLFLLSFGLVTARMRAVLTALAAWAVLLVAAAATWALSEHLAHTAAVVAAVSGLLIGLAPRLALASTGAFALDGQLAGGAQLRTRRVGAVVADAHLSLLSAVVLCALTGGVSSFLAATGAPDDAWVLALVGVLTISWLVRVRHFPLLLQRLAMWAAALAGLVGLARALTLRVPQTKWVLVLVLVAAAGAVVALAVRPPSELVAANVRRWAGRIETLAVVAVVPLLVGMFGVYADLIDTF